jgi:hypothetical protein
MELPVNAVFKVAAVSDNANSFGLKGMILMNKDGVVYQVGANSLYVKQAGDEIVVPCDWNECDDEGLPMVNWHFYSLGFEIPERFPDAPKNVVAEVWATTV